MSAAGLAITAAEESCQCLKCNKEIPRECIVKNIKPDVLGDTVQTVLAWCDHCKTLYEARRVLRGGCWGLTGGVKIVNNAKRISSFMARLDHLRGDKQGQVASDKCK